MIRRPPRSTRTDTLFPYTTLFRSCGALEIVPWARVVNLARALDEIAEAGYWRIGLDGEADELLQTAIGTSRIALVLGAEGEGLRHNSMAHCDILAKLPINPRSEEHTSELQSLMRISYAVFRLQTK